MAAVRISLHHDDQLVPLNLSASEKVDVVKDISVYDVKFLVRI